MLIYVSLYQDYTYLFNLNQYSSSGDTTRSEKYSLGFERESNINFNVNIYVNPVP